MLSGGAGTVLQYAVGTNRVNFALGTLLIILRQFSTTLIDDLG